MSVWDKMRRLDSEGSEPSPKVFAVVEKLILAAAASGFPPDAGWRRGYWPTVQLFWDGEIEVEVFKDRYELYSRPRDPMQVWEYDASSSKDLQALVSNISEIKDRQNG